MVQIQTFLYCNIIMVFLTKAPHHSHLTIMNVVSLELHINTWNWKKESDSLTNTKKILKKTPNL